MKTRQEIVNLLKQYTDAVKKIYGPLLSKIILYGSYARGDYHEDSDVDIMILLDVPPQDERKQLDDVSTATSDFNMEHDMYVMPMLKSVRTFKKWETVDPFFKNVNHEGVVLFGA